MGRTPEQRKRASENMRKYRASWTPEQRQRHNEAARRSRERDPEKGREAAKKWGAMKRATDPEWCEQKRVAAEEWRRRNPDASREYGRKNKERNRARRIRKKYGLSMEEYDSLAALGCAICGSYEKLVVDHDHETGDVRGILCDSHNTALGRLGDNAEGLRRALSYLEGGR